MGLRAQLLSKTYGFRKWENVVEIARFSSIKKKM